MATLLARLKNIVRDGKLVSVLSDKLDNDAVETINIKDSAITTNKILDNGVTTSKILDNSVVTSKIPDQNITNEKIKDEDLTYEKLSNEVKYISTYNNYALRNVGGIEIGDDVNNKNLTELLTDILLPETPPEISDITLPNLSISPPGAVYPDLRISGKKYPVSSDAVISNDAIYVPSYSTVSLGNVIFSVSRKSYSIKKIVVTAKSQTGAQIIYREIVDQSSSGSGGGSDSGGIGGYKPPTSSGTQYQYLNKLYYKVKDSDENISYITTPTPENLVEKTDGTFELYSISNIGNYKRYRIPEEFSLAFAQDYSTFDLNNCITVNVTVTDSHNLTTTKTLTIQARPFVFYMNSNDYNSIMNNTSTLFGNDIGIGDIGSIGGGWLDDLPIVTPGGGGDSTPQTPSFVFEDSTIPIEQYEYEGSQDQYLDITYPDKTSMYSIVLLPAINNGISELVDSNNLIQSVEYAGTINIPYVTGNYFNPVTNNVAYKMYVTDKCTATRRTYKFKIGKGE